MMKTKPETIARTIVLVIALINMILNIFGIAPIEIREDMIYHAVTALFVIGAAIWTWWKNNSFTKEAKTADEILRLMREDGIPAMEQLYALFHGNLVEDENQGTEESEIDLDANEEGDA